MLLFALLMLVLVVVLSVPDWDTESTTGRREPGISLIPRECCNLRIIRKRSKERIDLTPVRPNHQWFAATLNHLPVDTDIAIRLCMEGNDTPGNVADCTKWRGLRPLMTYADPSQYESYQWYRRDAQGRWIYEDLCAPATMRMAGSGSVPEQHIIPAHLAEEFLADDGATWYPWRELPEGEVDGRHRTFTMRCRFAQQRATIAMHVPYTVTYQETFLARLEAAHYPGVSVDNLGFSTDGRKLYVIRVDDPEHPTPLKQTEFTHSDGTRTPVVKIEDAPGAVKPRVMLLIAREHSTEHPPGWVLQGALRRLLDDSPEARHLRKNTTWLLLLMYDPDGVANSSYHDITDRFFPHENHPVYGSITPPEVIAYARYLRAFVNSGRMMAAVTSFYGLECNEGRSVLCPHVIKQEKELLLNFNEYWFSRLASMGILTNDPRQPWHEGWVPHRLHGWCWYWYGAFTSVFQLGDRYPDCRLHLRDLEAIGADYVSALVSWLETPPGRQRLEETRQFLERRKKERDLWFKTSMAGTPDDPTLYDMLSMGY